jgi:Tol biopolymer transport system component
MIQPKLVFLSVALVLTNVFCFSQGLPIKPTRTISFTTDEGTYMDVDISPDGKTIVFDLLGDIYTVPATGGKATQLTIGLAYNRCPVWSPDGK